MEQGRLFKIVYHLLDKGRATAPELAEKFEVSERAAVFLSCRSLCWRNRC